LKAGQTGRLSDAASSAVGAGRNAETGGGVRPWRVAARAVGL